jgi:hypothetical protein
MSTGIWRRFASSAWRRFQVNDTKAPRSLLQTSIGMCVASQCEQGPFLAFGLWIRDRPEIASLNLQDALAVYIREQPAAPVLIDLPQDIGAIPARVAGPPNMIGD